MHHDYNRDYIMNFLAILKTQITSSVKRPVLIRLSKARRETLKGKEEALSIQKSNRQGKNRAN